MLLAIHEQEKLAVMKKMAILQIRKEKEAKKEREMHEKVQKRVQERKEKCLKF
jgi:hypothetical protein